MLTIEQRKQALEAYREHCSRIVSHYEWAAEDDWLLCWYLATQAAGARVVPDDFVLVPKEPTEKMLRAGSLGWNNTPSNAYYAPWQNTWTAMLSAAPSPPALGEGWMPIETAPTEGDDGLGMIAIGRNAQANLPGEFVLNVELDKQQNIYTTFRTILSEPEFTMLSNILRRMIRDAAT